MLLLRIDDHEAALVILERTVDERQGALADRAEADHDNGAADATVNGPSGHRVCLLAKAEMEKRKAGWRICPHLGLRSPPGQCPGALVACGWRRPDDGHSPAMPI